MNKTIRIATVALALFGLAACGGSKQDDKKAATTTKKEAEKVQVLTLQSERIAKTLELSATLEGYETMNISPSITGHIEHLYAEIGRAYASAHEDEARAEFGSQIGQIKQAETHIEELKQKIHEIKNS